MDALGHERPLAPDLKLSAGNLQTMSKCFFVKALLARHKGSI